MLPSTTDPKVIDQEFAADSGRLVGRSGRMKPLVRWLSAAMLCLVALVGTTNAAWARTGNGYEEINRDGVSFQGRLHWYRAGDHHGGLRVSGRLYDTRDDNHSVFFQYKIPGDGWKTLWDNHKGSGNYTYGDYIVWNRYDRYISKVELKVCVDRNWPLKDVCNPATEYRTVRDWD